MNTSVVHQSLRYKLFIITCIGIILPSFFLLSCQDATHSEATAPIDTTPIQRLFYKRQQVIIEDSLRILIIGNSITKHTPLPQQGWYYDWGMAASSRDKDFVHVLYEQIQTHPKIKGRAALQYDNIAYFERHFHEFDSTLFEQYFRKYQAQTPDLVIFRLGDNTADSTAKQYNFQSKFSQLITFFKHNEKKAPLFIITSSWYPKPIVDQHLMNTCIAYNIPFVNIDDLRFTPGMSTEMDSIYIDRGIASHPGDKGMKAIADRIYQVFQPMVR